jgi:enamine deaminase RidA (YjgF/YER057c/UK114 family)
MKYLLTLLLITASYFSMAQSAKQFINPYSTKPSGYTHVVASQPGKTIYISGQIPVDESGALVGGNDLRAQTVQVYENLKKCLTAAGATFNDVVKMTTYVVNYKPSDLTIVREVRKNYLSPDGPPASTLVGVQSLASEVYLIEIEAIAVVHQ